MIRLKNKSKIERTIALAPTADVGVDTVVSQRVDLKSVRKYTRRLGDSIRLQPGETSRELPDAVALDHSVALLIRHGIVALVKI